MKESFRTGNPDIVYSGYPGSEYPKTCGSGFGYGGHGSYGTYGSCATYDHYKANTVDYNEPGCGGAPERPMVSACSAEQPHNARPSAPCSVTETFTGEDGSLPYGCAKPSWWGEGACQMPPRHCGGHRCNDPDAGCAAPSWWAEQACDDMPHKHCGGQRCHDAGGKYHAGTMESFSSSYPGGCGNTTGCGSLPTYVPGAADLTLPGDAGCAANFESQHNPGCTCTLCMVPYSMPYHAGPGCGEPHCNCPGAACTGSASCPKAAMKMQLMDKARAAMASAKGKMYAAKDALRSKWDRGTDYVEDTWDSGKDRVEGLLTGPNAMRNLLIAALAGYATYRLISRRR